MSQLPHLHSLFKGTETQYSNAIHDQRIRSFLCYIYTTAKMPANDHHTLVGTPHVMRLTVTYCCPISHLQQCHMNSTAQGTTSQRERFHDADSRRANFPSTGQTDIATQNWQRRKSKHTQAEALLCRNSFTPIRANSKSD